jgi:hypothetical protein
MWSTKKRRERGGERRRGSPACAIALLSMLASLLIAGCGSSAAPAGKQARVGSASTSTKTTTTTSTSSAGTGNGAGEEAAPSKAQQRAFAFAVNLRAGDLPGFTAKKKEQESESASEKQGGRAFAQCLGISGQEAHESGGADTSSPELERHGGELQRDAIQSTTTLLPSDTAAKLFLAVLAQRKTGTCVSRLLATSLDREVKAQGGSVGAISVKPITAPSNGFGWRASLKFGVAGRSLPVHFDLLGFIEGRAAVTLYVIAFPRLFPPAAERHAVSLLMQRAKANAP